jgi:hypothetical protein
MILHSVVADNSPLPRTSVAFSQLGRREAAGCHGATTADRCAAKLNSGESINRGMVIFQERKATSRDHRKSVDS